MVRLHKASCRCATRTTWGKFSVPLVHSFGIVTGVERRRDSLPLDVVRIGMIGRIPSSSTPIRFFRITRDRHIDKSAHA